MHCHGNCNLACWQACSSIGRVFHGVRCGNHENGVHYNVVRTDRHSFANRSKNAGGDGPSIHGSNSRHVYNHRHLRASHSMLRHSATHILHRHPSKSVSISPRTWPSRSYRSWNVVKVENISTVLVLVMISISIH
ncbi:unnamed protein product [Heligmosomoides polygyrus]|uniref:Uncharacterized protein n=1 Tax=Heligmosomoides polygyrus TaxID=6339 RepID=A0A3P8D7H0_HELPZ|nr:unnamed protein product [Heligmosomoides polygyrus]